MNMARAKRRWMTWERYTSHHIKLCGEYAQASRGYLKVHNERARIHNERINRHLKRNETPE